jgi:hypothetical protein
MSFVRWTCAAILVVAAVCMPGCSGPVSGNTAGAEVPKTPKPRPTDPVDELTMALVEMGAEPAAGESAPEEEYVILGDPAYLYSDEPPRDVTAEVALLREHVRELENSLRYYVDTVIEDLRQENAYLREELRRIYATATPDPAMRPAVPRPGSDVLHELHDEAEYYPPPDLTPTRDPSAPLEVAIVSSWGRAPEDAAKLGRGVTSLYGMIGSVPSGGSDEALLQLGRDLHKAHADYDNLNIEVFDSEQAAEAFANNNTKSTTRHVLSVARHAQSGVDEVRLYRNGLLVKTERF